MLRVLDCIVFEHHYGLLAVATLVCLTGAILTAQVSRRLIKATARRKKFQLFLAGLIGGATIWSTHFIAMLAYEPSYPHGYDPVLTVVSLAVAVTGLLGAMAMFGYGTGPARYLVSGIIFGTTVSTMHYVGMSAYDLPGQIIWSPMVVVVSVLLGSAFGVAAFQRLVYPMTQYCWLGGALLMVLAICAMHFTGMTAFTVELSTLYDDPVSLMSDTVLGVVVFAVTAVIFVIGFVGVNIEVSLEQEAKARIATSATIDALSGLPNRAGLSQRIEDLALALAADETLKVAVLTIDLNRFKEINDLHGHAAGDFVLREISQRFSDALSDDEVVARSGGDEFVALKRGFRRREQVKAFAERLHGAFAEPVLYQDLSLLVTGSIGMATTIEDGVDMTVLLQRSDMAMYRAKREFDVSMCFFNAEMDQCNRERLVLLHDLRQAIARDEFELVYQLQNEVASREPSGFEVLLRWNHPTRGRVSPAEFIPLAEEAGLIREIGLWVMRVACKEAASWDHPFSIAVNVAPQQLAQTSFTELLSDILLETGLDPKRLEIEITEASIIDDQEYTLAVMHRIKDMGVRIAMDDFGTGYSSLATLQAFPFDKIKIDRSFIQDVHLTKQRAAIVRSTLLLGEALEIPVLAEGVEVENELAFLRRENCKYVQGFLFGRPLSLAQVHDIVHLAMQSKDAS